jgi:Protein of unknown function (DUF3659)
MNSNRSSSVSYAYYSFPPTPNRSSPSPEPTTQSPPETIRRYNSMAPSPATGNISNPPQTPTRVGKNPASSSTSKLTGSPKEGAKSAGTTPRSKPPKLGASKAAQRNTSDSPKLPPRPQAVEKPIKEEKEKAESSARDVESTEKKIGLNDNEPSEGVEETLGKVSQPGIEAGTESTSVADISHLSEADPEPTEDDAEDITTGAKEAADNDAAEDEDTETQEAHELGTDAAEKTEDEVESTTGGIKSTTDGVTGSAKGLANKAAASKDTPSKAAGKISKGDAKGAVDETMSHAKVTAKDTFDDAKETAEDTFGDAKETAEDTFDDAKETAEDATDDLPEESVGEVGGVKGKAEEEVDGAKEKAGETVEVAKDAVEETADATDHLPVDLSILKGLKVSESGEVLNNDGEVVGQLEEGDPADLEGYEIGDNGEILDEDGDVVGRVAILPSFAEKLAGKAKATAEETAEDVKYTAQESTEEVGDGIKTYLPDINVLEGLEVQENGEIKDAEGTILGKITEGDPADLVGMQLNAEGEILDEDGDVVGRAEVLPQEVKEVAEDALSGIGALEGLEVREGGEIKDAKGKTLGKITEGDPADLVGKQLNAEGEILDEDGDVIGRAEIIPQEVADAVEQAKPDEITGLEEQLKPDTTILEGKKLNRKGNIIDDEGEVLAKLVEGDPKECAGKIPNENGEILDEEGNVIGKVEIVPGEAATKEKKELHSGIAKGLEADHATAKKAEAAGGAGAAAGEAAGVADQVNKAAEGVGLAILEGLKVNKKGEVVNEDGEPIARLSEGELSDVKGKKLNDKGEILDKDGNVLGKVEFISEAVKSGIVDVQEVAPETTALSTSILEGLKVNKKGEVLNEDGEPIARLSKGDLTQATGKKLNDKGEILDKDGNVIGIVEMIPQAGEEAAEEVIEAEDAGLGLPSLTILEGLKVNKAGKIVNKEGKLVGELIQGDAKKVWKLGATCDDKGQFWDGKGHVIGKAQTLPQEDDEREAEFAGLEGLMVVKDGWVEDENGNRVGQLVEGDLKRLVGRSVDEDGDIIDKRGNVVGHAERYTEPDAEEEPEPEAIDLSELKGLTCNKQGNVIGPDGVPIARLIEGNPKELAGRKIDENGQIWNESGKVVGRCELIPPGEREAKPEGPFAGLDDLVVVKDGLVEDSEHNVVGRVAEGDPKKLLGRAVDEDGDIIDKYGNVKGHVEPYSLPEEEVVEEDLSSLAGKKVNKQGKVVDEYGTIYGEIVGGDPKKLAGRKVDGRGQIWSDDGKIIGQARLIAGGDDGKAEGPFSNFESTIVGKDGMVKDASGQIVGRVIEGDHKKLMGRKVDDDGDILDKNGNTIGKAERWEPEEKAREINPMARLRINKDGEVRDKNGDVIGRLTDGNLLHCVGKEINDNGYVVDQDGNKVGEVTLLENIPEEEVEETGPTEEELMESEEKEVAKKIANIIGQTIEKMEPICKQITEVSSTSHYLLKQLLI